MVSAGECDVYLPKEQVFIEAGRRDAFCLFYDAKTKTVKAFNGSGRSPEKLTIDYVHKQGITGNMIPSSNLNSVTVPGCAAAWVDTVEKLGSGKLSLAEVLEPAIRLAEEG